jgi:hypothetical protein
VLGNQPAAGAAAWAAATARSCRPRSRGICGAISTCMAACCRRRGSTQRILREVEMPLIEIALGCHRRKSGEMRRSAGHQPQYPAQEDHRSRYSGDTPPQIDVKLRNRTVAFGPLGKATTDIGGRAAKRHIMGSQVAARTHACVGSVSRLRRGRARRRRGTLRAGDAGPDLALATYPGAGAAGSGRIDPVAALVLLADLVYVLVVAALVLGQVARMIAARRAQIGGLAPAPAADRRLRADGADCPP